MQHSLAIFVALLLAAQGMFSAAAADVDFVKEIEPIPSLRTISATEVPDSACRSAKEMCSPEKCLFSIRTAHLCGDRNGEKRHIPDGSRNGVERHAQGVPREALKVIDDSSSVIAPWPILGSRSGPQYF
jgi:hypothetical protein